MIVELAGPVGAGKSAVADGLPEALRARGVSASHLHEVARFSRPRTWLWNARFAVTHPRLAWAAGRAVLRAPIPWWHRRLILGLVLGVGGRIDFARRLVPRQHVVIVDEGLIHRSVNLFGWYHVPPLEAIRRYVALVPLPDELIYVEADPAEEHARALARGLPKRLAGRSGEDVAAFVAHARDVAETAVGEMLDARSDAVVVRLRNQRSLRRTITNAANATARLSTAVGKGSGDTLFRPRGPIVLRPDRLLARRAARRSGAIPSAQLVAVLERYHLTVTGRPRTLSAPGARGATARVPTSGGEVVVKRYKDGVDPSTAAIEHLVLEKLAAEAFPAPRLRRASGGETLIGLDGACYAVYDAIHGHRHPHELAMMPGDRRQLEVVAGRLLAELHRALERTEVPASPSLGFRERGGPRVRDVSWYTSRLASAPAPRRVRAWADAALWRLWETLDRSELPLTVVHGDYGPYNLLVRRGSVPVLVDFELARLDWRLVDLATGLPWYAQRRRGFDVPAARRMLDAYREASGAPGDELQRIPEVLAFLALGRAVVAWTRAEGEAAPRWNAEARHRVVLAEDLLAGRHPLNAVVHRW
jgi:Ser/Thr protein kinase RdoA (MazF antagonist)